MAVRFNLPADAAERVAFAYSPLLEAALSLHVLVEPKHHPLQHGWVRGMRRLPAALKRDIADLSFAYRWNVLDPLLPSPRAEYRMFNEELELFLAHDDTTLALEFLRPMWDHGGKRDPGLLERTEIHAHVERLAAEWGASPELARLIFESPRELSVRFSALLRAYWDAAFAAEWETLEPRLARAVADAGAEIATGGVYAIIGRLSPQLRVDRAGQRFGKDLPHEHEVDITDEGQLALVPSAYVWPHVFVNCDAPWPLSVIYPAGFVADEARPRLPPADLVAVLRAVGDDTRLRALKLIVERPRSTQELARLVGISEAGLSKHLRTLADAGLVTTRREGYYVLYSPALGRAEDLSRALLMFLSS